MSDYPPVRPPGESRDERVLWHCPRCDTVLVAAAPAPSCPQDGETMTVPSHHFKTARKRILDDVAAAREGGSQRPPRG